MPRKLGVKMSLLLCLYIIFVSKINSAKIYNCSKVKKFEMLC